MTRKLNRSTDYFRGTVMEPEVVSTLKASFGEYEALGKEHKRITKRIKDLQEQMKFSRQSGAFKALQEQMKEIKDLVKVKEDLDAKMSVADLNRKRDDEQKEAMRQEVSYSEHLSSVGRRIEELEKTMLSYSEGRDSLDYARCQRADGSFYGTRGKCRKGSEAGAVPAKETKPQSTASSKGKAPGRRRKTMADLMELSKTAWNEAAKANKAAKQAEANFKRITKETRGDKSTEAKRMRLSAGRDWDRATLAAERAQKRWRDVNGALVRENRRQERREMSPERRKSERELERKIRELG